MTRQKAKIEILKFIEMFFNLVNRHSHTGGVSTTKFEEAFFVKLEGV